jgi:dTDP-4-dehydrorhamnose 3,5-epimerase
MVFEPLAIIGAYTISLDPAFDERGFFARSYCVDEFATHGLNIEWVQSGLSYNHAAGTIRGLHYQRSPHEEAKLVSCTVGAIFDVIVDMRRASPTFGRWVSAELSALNRRQLYIPEGVAHGFQTLSPDTEVSYRMSRRYHPSAAAGVIWNDPTLRIKWPAGPSRISASDAELPPFDAVVPLDPDNLGAVPIRESK